MPLRVVHKRKVYVHLCSSVYTYIHIFILELLGFILYSARKTTSLRCIEAVYQ